MPITRPPIGCSSPLGDCGADADNQGGYVWFGEFVDVNQMQADAHPDYAHRVG